MCCACSWRCQVARQITFKIKSAESVDALYGLMKEYSAQLDPIHVSAVMNCFGDLSITNPKVVTSDPRFQQFYVQVLLPQLSNMQARSLVTVLHSMTSKLRLSNPKLLQPLVQPLIIVAPQLTYKEISIVLRALVNNRFSGAPGQVCAEIVFFFVCSVVFLAVCVKDGWLLNSLLDTLVCCAWL
jgi:hypothetical protein